MRQAVVNGLASLLRPVVKLCLKHGVSFQELSALLKEAFVERAMAELVASGQELSHSRVSMMTGVNRKEVARLCERKTAGVERESVPVTQRVLHHWQQRASGRPPLLSCNGVGSEFYSLVHEVSVDINPYTVLFELQRMGAVERDADTLRLVSDVYKPRGDIAQGYQLLSRDVENLCAAVEENIWDCSTENLHLSTEYDQVIVEAVPEIRAWLLERGSQFHREAREYLARFDSDIDATLGTQTGAGTKRARVFLGAFSRVELS